MNKLNKIRRTKIVCTLGPASDKEETIRALINAGLDAVRINFSHGTYESHGNIVENVKKAREALKKPIPLILDTKGPEIRIKSFKDNKKVFLEQGKEFTLTTEDIEGDETRVAVTYDNLPKDLKTGNHVLIDDGLVDLCVEEITETEIKCKIVNSGFLSSRKGVNVPDVYVNLPSLTEKDVEDIKFGIQQGFDYIAASFVRSASDVIQIRHVLEENGGSHMSIIAKIESRDGVNNLDSILEVADGIMVARGDLGVEIPPEEVPLVQKLLIRKANAAGKPVITATQMLESMVNNPRPTRAEANDVANAIFDGSDAIMLSGETASGKYPVEAVRMMSRIAFFAESNINYEANLAKQHAASIAAPSITNAISYATCSTAADLKAACIVTVSHSGFTVRMVARYKPTCPILCITRNETVWKQLNLVWGCVPILNHVEIIDGEDVFDASAQKAIETKLANDGDLIVIVAGIPVGKAGSTNCLKVQIVGDILAKGEGFPGVKTVVSGKASVIRVAEEAEKHFADGDILVTTSINTKMLDYVRKAKAVVIGGNSEHDAEYAKISCHALQIPLIICNERVVDNIRTGVMVTVDSEKGLIYNGIKS